jgi:DNA-binding CsgD family transcriptional regulator
MPSKILGTGNKKHWVQRPNTSHTSPGSIQLQQRRARALELRLAGKPFRAIAKELKCSPQTAFNYIATLMENTIPRESAAQLLTLELQRFDALLETFMPKARRGDKAAAELCLKIEHQRSRLCGLYPQPNTPLIFNANLNAESDFGFELEFVKPDRVRKMAEEEDRRFNIEHLPMPTETKQ